MSTTGSNQTNKVKIYIISLPIGNDADLSFRAKEILETADLLIGEESKFLSAFLKRIGIPRNFVLYNEHSNEEDFQELLQLIRNSKVVAFVSDAGLPNLEDPGRSLIPKLYDSGFELDFCPGASSLDAGLALCGFSTRPFTFVGLLPREPEIRKQELTRYLKLNHTLVILETPYRYKKIIEDLVPFLNKNSNRRIFLGLHLTHPSEQWMYRGKIENLIPLLQQLPKAPPIILIEGK